MLIHFRHFKYLRAMIAFIVVLSVSIVTAAVLLFAQEKEFLLTEERKHAERELFLIASLAQDAMLKNDYAAVEYVVYRWGEEHSDVSSLQARAPNQFIISNYRKALPAQNAMEIIYEHRFNHQPVIILEMSRDLSHLMQNLNRLRTALLLSAVMFVSLLGSLIWITLEKTAIVPLSKEIAERKNTEEALAESEKRFRDVAENALEFIWEVDAVGKYTYANTAVEKILGYSPEEMLEKHFYELLHPDDREEMKEGVFSYFSQKASFREFLNPNVHKDGNTIWLLTSGVPILDKDQNLTGYRGSDIDITKSKEAEDALVKTAQNLEKSNRDLQDFAYVASHDLQEPLRKITAFGDRLKSKYADALNDQGRDYLERMQNAARRMQTLIQGLLSFSRVTTQAKPFVSVDLNAVIRGVLSDLEIRIEEMKGYVDVSDLPTIVADPLQIRQLLQNLIGNALKFNKKDTPPVVNVQCEELYGANHGPFYQITVEDNGIGFDEKYAERIFGVFQRLHGRNEYEGTGIGLSVCRKIVERHGGSITASSKDQEGATFTIKLPVIKLLSPDPQELEKGNELVGAGK